MTRNSRRFTFNLFCDFFRYGGPGLQLVSKKWRQNDKEGFDFYLAGKKNYIVAKIDVRGTSFSGKLHKESQILFITTQCCQFFEPLWLFLTKGVKRIRAVLIAML